MTLTGVRLPVWSANLGAEITSLSVHILTNDQATSKQRTHIPMPLQSGPWYEVIADFCDHSSKTYFPAITQKALK